MILGIDHIALSCGEIRRASVILEKSGFKAKFCKEGICNHPSKKPFLSIYEDAHSMAYYFSEDSISFELTKHKSPLSGQSSFYQLLLPRKPADALVLSDTLPKEIELIRDIWKDALGESRVEVALWQEFCSPIWYLVDKHSSTSKFISAAIMPVLNLDSSEKFWTQGIGFKNIKRGASGKNEWCLLAFESLVARWSLRLVFATGLAARKPHLDDPGFTSVALITNNIEKDYEIITSKGAQEAGEIFNLEVNHKELRVCIIRGPSNELIELIQLAK